MLKERYHEVQITALSYVGRFMNGWCRANQVTISYRRNIRERKLSFNLSLHLHLCQAGNNTRSIGNQQH